MLLDEQTILICSLSYTSHLRHRQDRQDSKRNRPRGAVKLPLEIPPLLSTRNSQRPSQTTRPHPPCHQAHTSTGIPKTGLNRKLSPNEATHSKQNPSLTPKRKPVCTRTSRTRTGFNHPSHHPSSTEALTTATPRKRHTQLASSLRNAGQDKYDEIEIPR